MIQFIFELIHFLLFICLLILPYVSSKKFINTYGIYFSSFMTFVILMWVIFKNCPLSKFDKYNSEWGSTITFLNKRLLIKTTPYTKYIWAIGAILYSLSAFILAGSHTNLKVIIIILTSLHFYFHYSTLGTIKRKN